MMLVRFKYDRVAGGMSGAPVLNKQTGAVVGVVKSTEDRNSPVGGHFVPVGEIFRHLPEVFERNRSFFAAVPNHRWRRCEATLLRQNRGASLLRSTAHQWLLIGNGYFPFLPAHAGGMFPEVTRAPGQLQATLNNLPAKMRPEVHPLVDQPASKIEAGITAACAYPSQSSVLIYWGSRVNAVQYQVLHYESKETVHPSNIHLYTLKQWVEQLVLADKSVFLVLDLREIAKHAEQWLQADYLHPCIAFVGWQGNPPNGTTLAQPLEAAIRAIGTNGGDVTAQAVANYLRGLLEPAKWVVRGPERDFTVLKSRR